MPDYIRHPVV